MNCLGIIGNLTRDPELQTVNTINGAVNVCRFSVAVNNGRRNGQEVPPTFFNVSVWRQLGDNCAKYLAKGKKVFVMGPVSGRAYAANDGSLRCSLEITAEKVEFLSAAGETAQTVQNYPAAPAPAPAPAAPVNPNPYASSDFTQVETDELPF